MHIGHSHYMHSFEGLLPTQSQLSHDAAAQHAILTALRERRRNERRPIARRLGLAPGPQHSRRRRARSGRIDQPIRGMEPTVIDERTTKTYEVADE
jgi:hypothetical protein